MQLRIEETAWATFSQTLCAERELESAGVILAEVDGSGEVLVARHLCLVPDDGYAIRKVDQLQIRPVALNRYTRRAREQGLSILTVHTHPGSVEPWFSQADDLGDERLMPSFYLQSPGPHGSLVVAAKSGETAARVWRDDGPEQIALRIVGRTLRTMSLQSEGKIDKDWFSRQKLALGEHGQKRLETLHVGVVGLGGTGSVSAMQLAHMGVGRLTLVDGDELEPSNVSRIVGATAEEGSAGAFKVDVARRYIERLGLKCRVRTLQGDLGGTIAVGEITNCDVILSCVDRHTPRTLLNRMAYDNLIPVVDMGSGFRVDHTGRISSGAGRVVVVGPGRPCLACWGHIDPHQLHVESLSVHERARQAEEGYIDGADVAQPSVMPFNTMLSGAAVVELLRLVTGFAGTENPPNRLGFDFEAGSVRRNSIAAGAACRICGERSSAARPA